MGDQNLDRIALTVRLEPDLHRAFEEAAQLQAASSLAAAARDAIIRYVTASASDEELVLEVKRKQASLRQRAATFKPSDRRQGTVKASSPPRARVARSDASESASPSRKRGK